MSRFIGTFESVDPLSQLLSNTERPRHRQRRLALSPTPPASARRPDTHQLRRHADPAPIVPALVLFLHGLLHRGLKLRRPRLQRATSAERMSTSIHASNGIAFTEVPPPTRPTLNVVFGSRGTWKSPILRYRPAHCMNRIRHAERPVAVTAGSLECHPVAKAAHAHIGDAQARAIHRNELIDLPFRLS